MTSNVNSYTQMMKVNNYKGVRLTSFKVNGKSWRTTSEKHYHVYWSEISRNFQFCLYWYLIDHKILLSLCDWATHINYTPTRYITHGYAMTGWKMKGYIVRQGPREIAFISVVRKCGYMEALWSHKIRPIFNSLTPQFTDFFIDCICLSWRTMLVQN